MHITRGPAFKPYSIIFRNQIQRLYCNPWTPGLLKYVTINIVCFINLILNIFMIYIYGYVDMQL